MMRPRHVPAALALALLAAALWLAAPAPAEVSSCAAETYRPSEQPPFGGAPAPPLRAVRADAPRPPRYARSPREVAAIAIRTEVVRDELRESPEATPRAYTQGPCRWQVSYVAGGEEVARVAVDDRTGDVLEAWRDHQVGSELARGYDGAVAQAVNSPYLWVALCVLFVAPFLDRRRPFRLLHLDLLAIVALSLSLLFFNRGEITLSVGLTYPVLAYVLGRMLWAGLRPRARLGPLAPWASVRLLVVGAVILAAGRIAVNVADSQVIDVGVAGVVGADRVADGKELYEGGFSGGLDLRGDVYGPANYVAYSPFEALWPWDGEWDDVPAAHAAAIAFDLLVIGGLLALGRRLRDGDEGRGLGIALAFAWLACPWTLYAMNANANDSLVAASAVWALVGLASPAGRGVVLALGAAAKFGSAALAPLFATATDARDRRGVALFAVAFVLTGLLLFVPFLPDGGPSELYDRTLGYQATRSSPFSAWGLAPSLDFLQPVARIAAVALAVALAFVPRQKSPAQVAALAAAVVVAVQLTATHWFYFYVVWFLPLYLAAAFCEAGARPSSSAARRAAAS